MKSALKSILACVVVLVAGLASAQSFSHFNPPPCDFSDQFYQDNGVDSSRPPNHTAELNTEPDGRFGDFRQTGPPATGSQVNWVADSTCAPNDPTRRNFRILATTSGNADDGNSPFSCADQGGAFAVPQCSGQPSVPVSLEFISILAFAHSENFFEHDASTNLPYARTVGAINGGLAGQQQNAGTTISLTQGTDAAGTLTGLNPRGISMEYIVGNFEAYASVNQFPGGQFAGNPCAADMQSPLAPPTPCFSVADTISGGHTISDVATPKLRQNWRFATNRNAMDGSDNNCITTHDQACKHKGTFSDSPFGYFCDDLLGMWIITYFWFTQPPNTTDPVCAPVFHNIGVANGFTPDGFPVILTAHELNDELEANNCGAEGQEAVDGSDGGAAWLVCPAIPDPRNGAIATDAFLDQTTHTTAIDTFMSNNFTCLQQTGKFCFESSAGQ